MRCDLKYNTSEPSILTSQLDGNNIILFNSGVASIYVCNENANTETKTNNTKPESNGAAMTKNGALLMSILIVNVFLQICL